MAHSTTTFWTKQENPAFAMQLMTEGYIPWGPDHGGLHIQDDFGTLIKSLPQDHYWYTSDTASHILTMWLSQSRDTQYAYH
jgi:hypothetical protein